MRSGDANPCIYEFDLLTFWLGIPRCHFHCRTPATSTDPPQAGAQTKRRRVDAMLGRGNINSNPIVCDLTGRGSYTIGGSSGSSSTYITMQPTVISRTTSTDEAPPPGRTTKIKANSGREKEWKSEEGRKGKKPRTGSPIPNPRSPTPNPRSPIPEDSDSDCSEAADDDLTTEMAALRSRMEADMAYTGSYRGAIWNAQGFLACKPTKYDKKLKKILSLLRNADFLMINETHSTQGKAAAMDTILTKYGLTARWSHGGSRRGGVAVIIKNTFLEKFRSNEPQWFDIEAGTAAIMRLQGKEGNLDIAPIYLPTGNQGETEGGRRSLLSLRSEIRTKIARHIRSRHAALTILGGDFNYVTEREDRMSKATAEWSKAADDKEEEDFTKKLGKRKQLHEIYQPHATHSCAKARSRIDRVYTTQCVSEQLDTKLGCAALDWDNELSAHRPVYFFKTRKSAVKAPRTGPLPQGPLSGLNWHKRVTCKYLELLKEYAEHTCPMRRLQALKQAVHEVTWTMHEDAVKANSTTLAEDNDDKLGWTMRFIRAVEKNNRSVSEKCIRAYPLLTKLVDAQDPHLRAGGKLQPIKAHAIELSRAMVLAEMRAIQSDDGSVGEDTQRNRRSKIQEKLRMLKPGACNTVGAIKCADGTMAVGSTEIATELRRHWKEVFAAKPCDPQLLDQWLREGLPQGAVWDDQDLQFRIRAEDIRRAIRQAPNTMAGPDGLPYKVWKRLGDLGAATLFEAIQSLGTDGARERLQQTDDSIAGDHHQFNLGSMVFLPKKVAGVDPIHGDYYTATDVRPLVIVNTDNRIMASAMRIRLEPIFAGWISTNQRGFLSGRSMLSNVVDIEHLAQKVAMHNKQGAIMLLDFKAAFPSISHEYLHTTLKALGIPEHTLNLIKMLYDEHRCNINMGGEVQDGFDINTGIRQGCPLSPLIFALVMDILLRRIQDKLPEVVIRAFADDIALVIPDIEAAMPILQEIFHGAHKVANLELNMPKCVVIPLYLGTMESIGTDFRSRFPDWAAISVETKGTYLGMVIGPGAGQSSWDKPLKKFLGVAKSWGKLGMGLTYSAAAYAIYALPTLTFVGQLKSPSKEALLTEEKALRAIVPGPYRWILPKDLYYLSDLYGQGKSFPSLSQACSAAQRRVWQFEDKQQGGLRIVERYREQQDWIWQGEYFPRYQAWQQWFDESPVATLHKNANKLREENNLGERTLLALAGKPTDPAEYDHKKRIQVKKCFQKVTRQALRKQETPNPVARMRHKLERWHLPGAAGITDGRVFRELNRLHEFVPPKVCAAVLRTLWNGWTSDDRFQGTKHCVLGCCGFTDTDSIEHYAICPQVVRFNRTFLQLKEAQGGNNLSTFIVMGLNLGTVLDQNLALRAISAYAVYRTTILCRLNGNRDTAVVDDMLRQYAREAVRGHGVATSILEGSYTRGLNNGGITTPVIDLEGAMSDLED